MPKHLIDFLNVLVNIYDGMIGCNGNGSIRFVKWIQIELATKVKYELRLESGSLETSSDMIILTINMIKFCIIYSFAWCSRNSQI